MSSQITISPQPGPQTAFLSSPADIVIGGGAAGGGKSFGLLMEPLRHVHNPGFGSVIFRREATQVTKQGGLWDTSSEIYQPLGAKSNRNDLSWTFPSGARIGFGHLQYDKDRFSWDGSQVPLIGFDQLESFTEKLFWYMFSRNRSTCGVKPYIRATCNPVPRTDLVGGWLNRLIQWWWDPETGFAIPERSGKIRWLMRVPGSDGQMEIRWADTREALIVEHADYIESRVRELGEGAREGLMPKSFTFIPSKLSDNPLLLNANPGYLASLLALPRVERERLLAGNWKVEESAGKIFNRAWFKLMERADFERLRKDGKLGRSVRYWDFAGTEGAGCYTAGARMTRSDDGRVIIEHMARAQVSYKGRDRLLRSTAERDGHEVEIWLEQDPGSAGKDIVTHTVTEVLQGFAVRHVLPTGDKVKRAGPLASQAEHGNVYLVRDTPDDEWNEEFLAEAHAFEKAAAYKDQIDAASGGYGRLAQASFQIVPVEMG
jgi:predicted phage terminase large subunit-like protein